ncbi:MAG: aspartate aminotransferase family protein [Victivallales bacterium]|nr:aspartate aminotransferase family protein [Victivallales bacterium]
MYTQVNGPLPGPQSKVLLDQWHNYEADVTGYQAKVVWDHAEDCIVTDVDGNKFIDWTSGVLVTSVGHCHPRMVKVVQEAVAKLINNYESPTEYRIKAAKALMEAVPKHFGKCFFLTTGSEVTETAMRLMKRRTGKFEILSFQGGFHGRTFASASAGGLPGPKRSYGPTMPGIIRAHYPNPYRDPLGFCDDGPEFKKYFDYLDWLVTTNSTGSLAGLIVEPYQGSGGFVFPPAGWLKRLERWARERGILFTLDEVQALYGRTGKMFAMEHEGLKPDIVTLGKAIGCGMPVSAVVATDDVFSCLSKGELSSTLGGNPVSSSVVPVILDIIKEQHLVENSAKMGAYMKEKLQAIADKSKYLGCVRGKGLVMGLEFVKDKATKEPAPELIHGLIDACAANGLLVGSVGAFGNVIRVAPPLTITREIADESLAAMEKAVLSLSL